MPGTTMCSYPWRRSGTGSRRFTVQRSGGQGRVEARRMGRTLHATGQLTRASFQALIQSAAMAYHMTRAARGRACAGLRLAWQLVVTLPTRRLGLLPPALWSAPSGALVRGRLPRAVAQLGMRAANALRSLAPLG